MIIRFEDPELEALYQNGKEKGKPKYNSAIVKAFIKTIAILESASNTAELTHFKSLHFEALKHELKGFHSVRVNDQYRLVFKIIKNKAVIQIIVETIAIYSLTDYH